MTDTTQAVVDPVVTPAVPGVQTEGARTEPQVDPLDAALAEYDQSTTTKPATVPTPEPTPQPTPITDADLLSVKRVTSEWQKRMDRQDMESLVKEVRGDLDPDVFDHDVVEGWANAMAVKDPRLAQAWIQREQNPKAYAKVVKELGASFQKKFSKLPDRELTEDRMAVAAAVRGASSSHAPAAPAKDMSRMSNSEYRKHVIETSGFDPGV